MRWLRGLRFVYLLLPGHYKTRWPGLQPLLSKLALVQSLYLPNLVSSSGKCRVTSCPCFLRLRGSPGCGTFCAKTRQDPGKSERAGLPSKRQRMLPLPRDLLCVENEATGLKGSCTDPRPPALYPRLLKASGKSEAAKYQGPGRPAHGHHVCPSSHSSPMPGIGLAHSRCSLN